jgi:hypothetical protein
MSSLVYLWTVLCDQRTVFETTETLKSNPLESKIKNLAVVRANKRQHLHQMFGENISKILTSCIFFRGIFLGNFLGKQFFKTLSAENSNFTQHFLGKNFSAFSAEKMNKKADPDITAANIESRN